MNLAAFPQRRVNGATLQSASLLCYSTAVEAEQQPALSDPSHTHTHTPLLSYLSHSVVDATGLPVSCRDSTHLYSSSTEHKFTKSSCSHTPLRDCTSKPQTRDKLKQRKGKQKGISWNIRCHLYQIIISNVHI